MRYGLLLSIGKHTDSLTEQTRTKPQDLGEFKLKKQMEMFSFSPLINLYDEANCFLTVTIFGALISDSSITGEDNTFSISTPGHWSSRGGAEAINGLQKFLETRHQNYIKLHLEEVMKRRKQKNRWELHE